MTFSSSFFKAAFLFFAICFAGSSISLGHGDVTPQPMNTDDLEKLGEEWRETNPYRGSERAKEIGSSGYNQNCARCHGLQVISGGIAPDLRKLPKGDYGDEIYKDRVINGFSQNGAYKMPPFVGILSQEALWAIREYIETEAIDE